MLDDTQALEQAGASFIVYECIPAALASQATAATAMATIGIGAGADTNAQVLVGHDLLGLAERPARFVKNFLADVQGTKNPVLEAFKSYDSAVKNGSFPTAEQQY